MRRAAVIPQDEDTLAKSVAAFLRAALPPPVMFWHTPNGGSRAHVTRQGRNGKTYRFSPEAQKLKAMGVLAGFPDLAFVMPNAQLAVIELKVGDNTLSDEQIDVKAGLRACGVAYEVAYSFDEVVAIVTRWLAAYGLTLRARTALKTGGLL